MPEHAAKAPDYCNVVIYGSGDDLYMVDSVEDSPMRESVRRVIREACPVHSFTLINTHAHLDHICNNDVIAEVQADHKYHYLSRSAIDSTELDAPRYFAAQITRIEAVYDPMSS